MSSHATTKALSNPTTNTSTSPADKLQGRSTSTGQQLSTLTPHQETNLGYISVFMSGLCGLAVVSVLETGVGKANEEPE